MSKIEVKFQADGIRHQLMQFMSLLNDHPKLKNSIDKRSLAAIVRTCGVLSEISKNCEGNDERRTV